MGKPIKITVATLAVCLLAVPTWAQGNEGFVNVVKPMADYFAKANTFSVSIAIDSKMEVGDQKRSYNANVGMKFQRPGTFHLTLNSPSGAVQYYGDGQTINTFVPQYNQYTQQPQPKDEMAHPLLGTLVNGYLTAANPWDRLKGEVKEGALMGSEMIGAQKVDQVRFTSGQSQVDLWVTQGGEPKPVKLQVTQEMQTRRGPGKSITTITYSDWKVGQAFGQNELVFKPDGIRKVKQFSPPSPEELVGTAAAGFVLKDLSGNAISLADHKGKDIVVLDFWATWCGPCRKAMPIIDRVTGGLADKNVVLYAVNLREDKAKIESFLKKQEMDVKVLLDEKATVAGLFRVNGIPQTVIIDKQGVIQAVHVGLAGDLEQLLTQELQTLVDGGSLIENKE